LKKTKKIRNNVNLRQIDVTKIIKNPQNLENTRFAGFGSLLKLHGSRRLRSEVVHYAVNALNFVDDAAHDALEDSVRNV
jgi:hypothetical protein